MAVWDAQAVVYPSHLTHGVLQRRRTVLLGELAGGPEAGVVDGLEDLLVQLLRLGAVEGQAQQDERVRQPLRVSTTHAHSTHMITAVM